VNYISITLLLKEKEDTERNFKRKKELGFWQNQTVLF
jgi:hypothetical protein